MTPTWHPAPGSAAALIQELSLVLYAGCTLIFVFVMALLLRAVFSAARPVQARRWLAGGGLAFPGVVLTLLLFYGLAVSGALGNFNGQGVFRFLLDCISSSSRSLGLPMGADALNPRPTRIEVTGRQWWWEARYIDDGPGFTLANEIHLPAGRAIDLVLKSEDVIHSFWVPALAGKVDMIPGRINRLRLKADVRGVFRGQCAEYCGGQHALMGVVVVVEPEADYERWRARQMREAAQPADAFLALGRTTFLRAGCGECHTVRGTAAAGKTGPDLTHVGGRFTLAAATLDNHIGTMAGWIANPQDLKPGNLMPNTRNVNGRELRALAAWLGSLE
jgi:cytochrome c oxidase subunit 2